MRFSRSLVGVLAVSLPTFILGALSACSALVGYDDLQKASKSSDGGGGGRSDGGPGSSSGDPEPTGEGGAPDAGPRCNVASPFGAPQLVAEFDADKLTHRGIFSADELDAFYSARANLSSPNVFRHAKRSAIGAPWTIETLNLTPTPLFLEAVTVNGRKLYYDAVGGLRVVTRPDRNSAFGASVSLNSDTDGYSGLHVVDSDDLVYYDKEKSASNTEVQILKAAMLVSGAQTGDPVPGLDLPGVDDWDPVLNASQTAVYFARGPDNQNVQMMVARRPDKQAAFGTPVRILELEDAANDHVTWVSDDECLVLLNRSSHVFMAQRGK